MRIPSTISPPSAHGDTLEAFEYEVMQEVASAIGRIGKQLEASLAALRRHDETERPNTNREELLWDAAEKAMALMIQREAFGMRSSSDLQKFYAIPREVMIRIGAQRPKASAPK